MTTFMTTVCLWLPLMAVALDNGVARRPPMGWMSWVRFGCNVWCDFDADNCITERLYRRMADIMAAEGYRDAGYEYVSVDDCWMEYERDAQGRLQANAKRFPNGIAHLADYMHARGLKLGLYADIGTQTCAGYPGSIKHVDLDAATFAAWGIDMLKVDGCNAKLSDYEYGFPAISNALNRTGRPIVYSCQWPMYARYYGGKVDYRLISATCNMFRALTDMYDSFYSVQSMIDYYSRDNYNLSAYARPGAWNDPDQLVIGNFGLSDDQERVHMAMWAMWSAPLMMSNDLRSVKRSSKRLLLNKNVIRINQDELGVQARLVIERQHITVWVKRIVPAGSVAVAILNRSSKGPLPFSFSLGEVAPNSSVSRYRVTEVFDGRFMGVFKPTQQIDVRVNPTGVYLITAVPSVTVCDEL